jgi:cation diffusion facilitator CzcD-associated flavoprotein CzcO
MSESPRIAIIGAGFSGIGMAVLLKKRGITSFTIFEAADDVGGTWRDNTYPGCACDVPSALYSFSFDLSARWSYRFGRQPEIWEYLRDVTARHGIAPFIQFGAVVTAAEWDAQAHCWRLTLANGERHEAEILIGATGPLSVPATPDVPGMSDFDGPTFHSAKWRHDVDLTGKRVAVIGTGASAIQFVPEIAPIVESLHLFQRTPPWIIPRADRAFSPLEKQLTRWVPGLKHLTRYLIYYTRELMAFGFVSQPGLHRMVEHLARRFIEKSVPDPELRAAVTPDYTLGCKRILLSNDYYPALCRDNVAVIPSALQEVRGNVVVAADGTEREVDAIIWGTGFGVRDFMSQIHIVGRDGVELNEAWRNGIEAYYGMNVSGFPNLFLMLGPNTGLGHSSVVFMAEAQIHYILECIAAMGRRDLSEIDVLSEAQRRFNANLQTKMQDAVWMTGCRSWYLDEHGRNDTLWPSYTLSYWLQTRRVDWSAYQTA